MTSDSLITKKFLDDEIAERTLRDANMSGYSGQPLVDGEPEDDPPIYTSLIDLTQSLPLLGAISRLDATKNTAMDIYDNVTLQGTNPNVFKLVKSYSPSSLTMSGRTMILNLNQRSTGYFVTGVSASFSWVSVIGASYLSFGGISASYDYAYFA